MVHDDEYAEASRRYSRCLTAAKNFRQQSGFPIGACVVFIRSTSAAAVNQRELVGRIEPSTRWGVSFGNLLLSLLGVILLKGIFHWQVQAGTALGFERPSMILMIGGLLLTSPIGLAL